jgi:hypothetical protein
LTLVSTTASTFQCGVALGRTANVMNGKANYNKWLDDSPVFSSVMTALNVIQITDVVKTLGKQALLYKILSRNGIKSGNLLSMYKQMPRASRKRLAEEILQFNHRDLEKSHKVLKQVLNGTKLLDDGTKAITVYRQVQVQQLMATKFLEILGSGITVKGSTENAYDGIKNSLGFIIGFGNNK